jgi:hypothetical protein
MQISTQDQQALILGLSETIRDAQVSGWGTHFSSDFILPPLSDPMVKRLKKTLDRGGVSEFARTRIHTKVLQSGYSPDDDHVVDLRSIDGFTDHLALAKYVVDELKTLPWSYQILVRGPAYVKAGSSRNPLKVKISDQLNLVSSDIIKKTLSFSSGNPDIDDWMWKSSLPREKRKLAEQWLYFVFNYTGYISPGQGSKISGMLTDELRAFYGRCLAHGLLHPYGSHREDAIALIILGASADGIIVPLGTMDSDVRGATSFYTSGNLGRAFRSSEKLQAALSPIQSTFSCGNSARLKTAAMWLLRAHMSQKPIDKVLESAITLEVLLGDREMSDKIGLTKLMANRCAYALGKSQRDRADIIQFFLDFYRLRSDVVHTGRLNMDEGEESLVDRGVDLASEMLVYEQNISCLAM